MRQIVRSKKAALIAATVVAAVLTACGGGGGGSPGVPIIPPSGGGAVTPVAQDLIVTTSKAAIPSASGDSATLTVLAVDSSRNVVASVPVSVSVDNNAVFTPTGSTGKTGTDGSYGGQITIGADKSNRLIHYTVTAGSIQKTGAVSVTGTNVRASLSPQVAAPEAQVTLTVTTTDSSSAGVAGASVTLSGLPGQTIPVATTNSSGVATFTFNVPAAEGFYTLTANSLGVSTTSSLQVSSGGSVPPAVGPVSGASALANPVVVPVSTPGSAPNQSQIRALFYGVGNSPIPNMRARFSIVSTALPGESLSTGSNLVYSDVTGSAATSYNAPTTGSPTNGVVIKVCYDLNDFPATACPSSVQTNLTVTASPISITIGQDNKISKSSTGISYVKTFEIQAVDSAGNAKVGVPLSALVDIVGYWKGPSPTFDGGTFSHAPASYVFCPNEDTNRNGILDAGEDVNHNGVLDPRKSDVSISFVNGNNKTDANGLAQIQLTYPQSVATWEYVGITVNAGVSGSEGSVTEGYVLGIDQADIPNGSFLNPPYGQVTSCSSPL